MVPSTLLLAATSVRIAKIYPLDAMFDVPEDVPDDVKSNKRAIEGRLAKEVIHHSASFLSWKFTGRRISDTVVVCHMASELFTLPGLFSWFYSGLTFSILCELPRLRRCGGLHHRGPLDRDIFCAG